MNTCRDMRRGAWFRHVDRGVALDELGAEYRILSPTEAQLFTPLSVTRLTRALSARQCELLHVHEQDESLESFYMNLVGGEHHA